MLLSFIDAYSEYNQILRNEAYKNETSFMMEHVNYH